jgi:hypothetical protein
MSEPSAYPDWVPPPLIEAIEWTHAEEAWERLLLRDQEDIAAFVGPPDAYQSARAYEIANRLVTGRPLALRWLRFKGWVDAVLPWT